MYIPIKKSDLLQSVGFALTSAKEEFERVRSHISEALQNALEQGHEVMPEAQAELGRALTKSRDLVHKLDVVRRMGEYAADDADLWLDPISFELLEANLPAR